MKIISHLIAAALLIVAAKPAAATVEFIPPYDPVGRVESWHANTGYSSKRGVVFTPTEDFNLTAVGIYQDVTKVLLTYGLVILPDAKGYFGSYEPVRLEWQTFSTAGLQYSDFAVAPITLKAGTIYYLWFAHADEANQNLFHSDEGPFTVPGFSILTSTFADQPGGAAFPRIRLNGPVGGIPEPAMWTLLLVGFGMIGGGLRGIRRSTASA